MHQYKKSLSPIRKKSLGKDIKEKGLSYRKERLNKIEREESDRMIKDGGDLSNSEFTEC